MDSHLLNLRHLVALTIGTPILVKFVPRIIHLDEFSITQPDHPGKHSCRYMMRMKKIYM